MEVEADRLAGLIPAYPRPDDPDLLEKLAHLEEFRELTYQAGVAETVERGELLATQKFAQRLFNGNTLFNRALFWREPGTGKTCSAGAIIEEYAKFRPPGWDSTKKALVIVKNSALVEVFRREIAEVCAPGVYASTAVDEDLFKGVSYSEAAIADRMRRAVAKVYDIKTFNDIVLLVNSTDPAIISSMYSGVPVIVDEAHAIHQNSELSSPDEGGDDDDQPEAPAKSKAKMYEALHTFLHCLKGGYQILMTGTPMWDSATEFADLMNLILPLDGQLPTGKAFLRRYFDADLNLTDEGEAELKEKCRGMISFLRAAESTIGRQEMGVALNSQMVAFPVVMSTYQADAVRQAASSEKNMIHAEALDASDMVLPVFNAKGKIIGKDWKNAALHIDFKTHQLTSKYLEAELKKNLAKYSAKFATVIDLVTRSPQRCFFIHVRRVKGVGGAIFLGAVLSLFGFERIIKADHIEKPSARRRFCVMTTDPTTTSTPADIAGVCAAASKPNNFKGDHLQIVIGSDKVILGITLKNFTSVIQVRSHWGPSAIDQTMFRALRQGSHDNVPPGEVFKIYRLTAIYPPRPTDEVYDPGKENVFPPGALIPRHPEESVNVRVLEIVENKDRPMAQIRHRVAKPIAFDCVANYQRNVLPTDQAGTRQCDYGECNYQCDGVPVDETGEVWSYPIKLSEVDYSTYNLLFSGPELTKIKRHILELLMSRYTIHLNEIFLSLSIPDQKRDLVYEAVSQLVNARVTVTNSLGVPCYVKESSNYVFLDSNIGQLSSFGESIYTSQVYVTYRQTLSSMVDEFIFGGTKITQKLVQFCKSTEAGEREEILQSLSPEVLASVYEEVYSLALGPKGKEAVATITNFLRGYVFDIPGTPPVHAHVILRKKPNSTSYGKGSGVVDPKGKLRVLGPSGWTTPSEAEQKRLIDRYKASKQLSVDEIVKASPTGIVGTLASDGKFRVRMTQATMTEVTGKKPKKASRTLTGQVAATMDVKVLRKILVKIFSPNLPVSANERRPREDLEQVLIDLGVEIPEGSTDAYVRGLMNIYSMKDRRPMSDLIQHRLREQGLLIEV